MILHVVGSSIEPRPTIICLTAKVFAASNLRWFYRTNSFHGDMVNTMGENWFQGTGKA